MSDPTVDAALSGLREVLGADGYGLDYTIEGGSRISVTVVAGPDACADCLVPPEVMRAIMSDALAATPFTIGSLALPAKSA